MGQWISGRRYALGLGTRFGAFIIITLAFPLFVYGVIEISGARGVDGASGALAMVLGIYLKPLIYLCLAGSTLRNSLKRARTIGISTFMGLCIPVLILADLSFGITFGSSWAVGFSLGIVPASVPTSLLAAAIAIVTLSLVRDFEEPLTGRIAILYGIWKILLFIFVWIGLIKIFAMLSPWLFGASATKLSILLLTATSYLGSFLIYPYGLLLAFAAASAALVLASRRPTTGGGSRTVIAIQNQAPLFGSRKI